MRVIETVGGTALGISLVNGKIKPKYGIRNIIGSIILILLDILFIYLLINGILDINLEFIEMCIRDRFRTKAKRRFINLYETL